MKQNIQIIQKMTMTTRTTLIRKMVKMKMVIAKTLTLAMSRRATTKTPGHPVARDLTISVTTQRPTGLGTAARLSINGSAGDRCKSTNNIGISPQNGPSTTVKTWIAQTSSPQIPAIAHGLRLPKRLRASQGAECFLLSEFQAATRDFARFVWIVAQPLRRMIPRAVMLKHDKIHGLLMRTNAY
jgi:hypothetical protein